MQLLQDYLMTCLSKLKLKKNSGYTRPTLFVGWSEGLGMYDCEESPKNANVTQDFCP